VRFDSAGPRTWLLAATAVWAALIVLLALLGMGRQVAPLTDDTAPVKPPPSLVKAMAERLGARSRYDEITKRPLFSIDRQPHAFSLRTEAPKEQAKPFDFALTSVVVTPALKVAIIRSSDGSSAPLRIKLGEVHETLPNWRLQSLDARSAVFAGPEGERRLDLRVYSGVGGEAPTTVTAPAANPRPTESVRVPSFAPPSANSSTQGSSPPLTEHAQLNAIRKRIEARRAQLRSEALLRNNEKPSVK